MEEKEAITGELCTLMKCDSIKESDDAATILVGLFSSSSGAWEPALLRIVMAQASAALDDPVPLVRYLFAMAKIFEKSSEETAAELVALQFPGLIFRCCRSTDVILQMLCMEMMVGLNKYPTFISRCVSSEFQSWLLDICNIESGPSGRGSDSIAAEALRVLCSAVSSARRRGSDGSAAGVDAATLASAEAVAISFKERLTHFLSSRNEAFVLTGLHCFAEFACSSLTTIQELMNSSALVEAWASSMRSGRVSIKQTYFDCIVIIFEDLLVGNDDTCTLALYSKLSEHLNKDFTEYLIEVCKSSAPEIQLSALKLLQLIVARPWIIDFSRSVSAVIEFVITTGSSDFLQIPRFQAIIDSLGSNPRVDLLGRDTAKMLRSTRLTKSVFAAPETL